MSITLRSDTIRKIIRDALLGLDHRAAIITMIDDLFVEDAMNFLKKVVEAKEVHGTSVDNDWYLSGFLSKELAKSDIAWNAGLNLKSITNMRGGAKKDVVLADSISHYRDFVSLIDSIDIEDRVHIDLQLSLSGIVTSLNFAESVVVMNALAVRRAAIRGGAWSSLGKQVEGPLMEILCRIHDVSDRNYRRDAVDDESIREVDFYLVSDNGDESRCEVKLMGKGNPESADAVVARESKVFVASTLSAINKSQLDDFGVHWTELQQPNGFVRFSKTLSALGIKHIQLSEDSDHTERIEKTVSDHFD